MSSDRFISKNTEVNLSQNHINMQLHNENSLVISTKEKEPDQSTVYHKSGLLFAAKNIMRLSPGLLLRDACLYNVAKFANAKIILFSNQLIKKAHTDV